MHVWHNSLDYYKRFLPIPDIKHMNDCKEKIALIKDPRLVEIVITRE
jgi:hypothetical protein